MQKCKYGVAQSVSLTEQDGQIFPNICQRRGGYVLPPENAKIVTKGTFFTRWTGDSYAGGSPMWENFQLFFQFGMFTLLN